MTSIWAALALACCLASTAHARQLLQATTNATCPVTEDAFVESYALNQDLAISILSLFNSTAIATDADCVTQVCLGIKVLQDAGLIPNPPISFQALLRIATPCRALDDEASNTVLGQDFVFPGVQQPAHSARKRLWRAHYLGSCLPSPATTTTPSPASLTTCPANTAALTAAYTKNKAEAVRVYSLFYTIASATTSACLDLFCVGLKIVIDAGAVKTTPTTLAALAALPDDCVTFEESAAMAVLGGPFYKDAKAFSDSACGSEFFALLPSLPGATCGGLIQWPQAETVPSPVPGPSQGPVPGPSQGPVPGPSQGPVPGPSQAPAPGPRQAPVTTSTQPEGAKPKSVGPIIGGVVAGIVLLGVLVGALVWWRRRSSKRARAGLLPDTKNVSAPPPVSSQVKLPPKSKPLVPGYKWVSELAEGRTSLQAGVNDVQLDTQKQLSSPGSACPVIQLTPDQVAEHIQLLSDMPMGSGGCGHVYKCVWDSRFPGALLAAKILPSSAKHYDLAWQSFQHETNILKAMNHPNIVRIYGFCLDQPTVCIIMELLDFSVDRLVSSTSWLAGKLTSSTGTTPFATDITNSQAGTSLTSNTGLADGAVAVTLNEPSTSLTMKRVLRVVIDVSAGLEHLHAGPARRQELTGTSDRKGAAKTEQDQVVVIHRDVKPDNMLVNAKGQTKLCDFGISRETLGTILQTRQEGVGTIRYMAPEVLVYRNNTANSGVVGKKVDIYSLGIVLFELVSRRSISALEAEQVPSGVRPALITEGEPEAVQARLRELECSEEVLRRVEGIITRCWHHLPNNRPTATELKEALVQVQDSLGS